uniref:Uncharacterized protein n=1 Tax=Kalanchoe fedtschenkoi TaxID=63787 RepID=A0A7N0TNH1_KALFE
MDYSHCCQWICGALMVLCLASCVAGSTRSWDAIGFHENIPHSPHEREIIVAVVDSGIWPELPSFSAKGLGPPPRKWKGICQTGNSRSFRCNNKIIGARVYIPHEAVPGQDMSPRDTEGHGTHIAAIVAGAPVKNVSINGVGLGTARGAVPRARLAVYKVCWGHENCPYRTLGVEDAVNDGADIIVMTGGGSGTRKFGGDVNSYHSFHAMKAGLFLAFSAGDTDSLFTKPFTVSNTHPWVMTVGNSAGSGTDYATYVTSGDGKRFEGNYFNVHDTGKEKYPLVLGEQVTHTTDASLINVCNPQLINPESVKGKIILCKNLSSDSRLWNFDKLGCAGVLVNGAGGFFEYFGENLKLFRGSTPVAILREQDFNHMTQYYNNSIKTRHVATASIEKTVDAADTLPRPAFSSQRGPNLIDMSILKPDISAPGANMIAVVPGTIPGYTALSGTSMATPFAAGAAAYVKSFHPHWSPSAIKSALMTTATPMSDPYENQAELAYGTGQINPAKAADPGLVYDASEEDYVKYLCKYGGFDNKLVLTVTHDPNWNCTKMQIEEGWTLNYPSFSIPAVPDRPFSSVFRRTLTNVGNPPTSNYKAVVNAPKGLTVQVEPTVLAFTEEGQSLSYTLTVHGLVKKNSSVLKILTNAIK